MRLSIVHKSQYDYDAPVTYALQRLHQSPRSRAGQTVVDWRTELDGADLQESYRDHFNNVTDLISVRAGTQRVTITASGEVDTEDLSGIVGAHKGFAPLWLFLRETPLTARTQALRALAREVDEGDDVERMHRLMEVIARHVAYGTGATDASTTADEALAAGKGVCQDHTHIFLSVARHLGYPARYVSGFLMMEGQSHQAASHAWAEIHIESLGWVGYDVSNGISPDERYVCVATGLDYRDAAPISGIRHGLAGESLSVSVIVEQQ